MNQRRTQLPPVPHAYGRADNYAAGKQETRVSWGTDNSMGDTGPSLSQAAHMNNQARSDRSLGGSANNFMGVNFAELISRVLHLKQEWLGDLGSHLFPDKEQEGQALFAFAVVAVYMVIKIFMGSTSGLVVSVGLFLAGGWLTKHPSKSDSETTAHVIALDGEPLPSKQRGNHSTDTSRDRGTGGTDPATGRREKSLLQEAVDELRNTHRSAGISSSSGVSGGGGHTAYGSRPIARSILEQEQRRQQRPFPSSSSGTGSSRVTELPPEGEGEREGDEYLQEEFAHHRKAWTGAGAGAGASNMDFDFDAIEESESPRHARHKRSNGVVATARRNQRSRIMRVQIKPKEEGFLNMDNIILR